MKLSVNFEDSYISKDGKSMSAKDRLPAVDPNYRVLQWVGTAGWIEVYDGERIWLSHEGAISLYVEIFDTLAAEEEARVQEVYARAAAAEAAIAAAEAAANNGV